MKKIVLLLLIPFFFACQKEDLGIVTSVDAAIDTKERYIKEFTDFSTELDIGIGAWAGGCQGTFLNHVHGLRFQEGFQSGDEYFYQVQIKTINYNDCDTFYNGNWMEINKLYRYSFDQKKSFVYVSVDDPEPKLLFDFNCSVGDTVFLDEEMYVRMLVTAIDEQQIDGVGFPVVSGKIISFSRDSYFNSNDDILIGSNNLSLTPFSPNPFWAGSSIGTYFNSSWNNSDFCVPATAARVHGIKMACKNLLNSSIFSSYYFVVPD